MSPVHGKVPLVQVKEPYGNLDMVTPAEARVRQKNVIVNADKLAAFKKPPMGKAWQIYCIWLWHNRSFGIHVELCGSRTKVFEKARNIALSSDEKLAKI